MLAFYLSHSTEHCSGWKLVRLALGAIGTSGLARRQSSCGDSCAGVKQVHRAVVPRSRDGASVWSEADRQHRQLALEGVHLKQRLYSLRLPLTAYVSILLSQ